MTHGSLFSGIGGFDLAAEWMGWENIFHCEIEPFNQKILKHYWPKATSYADIKKTDFTIHRGTVDILTGGFPCQPYSQAGKRLGKEDDRHLWPEMLRTIREVSPRWVVGENVRGLTNWNGGMVFDEVQADLEAEGYEVLPFLLPACAVNAPHRRDRIWFVAYSINNNWRPSSCDINEKRQHVFGKPPRFGNIWPTANPGIIGCNNGGDNRQERHIPANEGTATEDKPERDGRECRVGETCANATNPNGKGLQRSQDFGGIGECRENNNKQFARFLWANWKEFPTQPPVCGGNDGLPTELAGITIPKHRNNSIKSYGNAIVPQVAHEIFKAIEAYEQLKTTNNEKDINQSQ